MSRDAVSRGALCAALLFFYAAAKAESLPELARAAQSANAAYLAAQARLDGARESLPLAEGALQPFVSASGNLQTDIGGDTQTTRGASANLSYPIYDRALLLGPQAAQSQERAAESTVQAAAQNLLVAVANAYLDALLAQDNLRLIRARKAAIGEQLQLAQSNLDTGVGTATDVQEAQARLEESAAEEIAAGGDVQVRYKEIERLCGIAPDSLDALIADFGEGGLDGGYAAVAEVAARAGGGKPPVGENGDEKALLSWFADVAAAANPDLRAAEQSLAAARVDVEIKKAEVLPKFTLSAGINYSRMSDDNSGGGGGGGDDNSSVTRRIGVNFEMPLYSSRINPALRGLIAEERALALDAEGMRRELERRALEYYLQIDNGAGRIRALTTAVAANRAVLRSTKIGFQSGVRINSDVLNAQESLFDAELQLQEARYNYLASRLGLAASAGVLDDEALAEFAANFAPPR
jgi:outer membrane protein